MIQLEHSTPQTWTYFWRQVATPKGALIHRDKSFLDHMYSYQ